MQNSHDNFKQLQVALNARYSHGAWVSGSITELVYAKEISWSLSKRFHHSSIHVIHKYTERLIKFVKTFKRSLKSNAMHSGFVLPCNCLSSRQLSRVKIVQYYISATVTAATPTLINQPVPYRLQAEKTQTIPGQLGGWWVDHVLDFDANFPALPRVKQVPHLQRQDDHFSREKAYLHNSIKHNLV